MKYSKNVSSHALALAIGFATFGIASQISYMQSVSDQETTTPDTAVPGQCDEANPVGTCPAVENSTPSCVDGICIQNCLPGYREEDGSPLNGCETKVPVPTPSQESESSNSSTMWQNPGDQGQGNPQGSMMPPGDPQFQSPYPWMMMPGGPGGSGPWQGGSPQGPWGNPGMQQPPQWNQGQGGMMSPSGDQEQQKFREGPRHDGPMPNFCLLKPAKVLQLMDTEMGEEDWPMFATFVEEAYDKLADRVAHLEEKLEAQEEKKKPNATRIKQLQKQLLKAEKNFAKCEAVLSAVQEKAGTSDDTEDEDFELME